MRRCDECENDACVGSAKTPACLPVSLPPRSWSWRRRRRRRRGMNALPCLPGSVGSVAKCFLLFVSTGTHEAAKAVMTGVGMVETRPRLNQMAVPHDESTKANQSVHTQRRGVEGRKEKKDEGRKESLREGFGCAWARVCRRAEGKKGASSGCGE